MRVVLLNRLKYLDFYMVMASNKTDEEILAACDPSNKGGKVTQSHRPGMYFCNVYKKVA